MKSKKWDLFQGMKAIEIDQEFIASVMKPYRKHATYLKKATFYYDAEKGFEGLLIKGEFAIDESCYIEDTGHFNAVEYNICYNQLGYVFFGYCIQHKLLPELEDYTFEAFLEQQLPHFLILKIASSFSSVLNAKKFYGVWGISSVKKTSKTTFLQTYCDFEDGQGGNSFGEVTAGVLPAKQCENR